MHEEVIKTLRINSEEIGENTGVDRNALKGYKAERKLIRIINDNNQAIIDYLGSEYKIPESIRVRLLSRQEKAKLSYDDKNPREKYEYFTCIELFKNIIISLSSLNCIEALSIHEQDGLERLIDFVQKTSPIQLI